MTELTHRQAAFKLTLRKAIKAAGGIMGFARSLKVSHQAVYHWQRQGYVPLERALDIEKMYGTPYRLLLKPEVVEAMRSVENPDQAGADLI